MEKYYGRLYAQFNTKWEFWRDKMFLNYQDVGKYEVMYDIKVNYE